MRQLNWILVSFVVRMSAWFHDDAGAAAYLQRDASCVGGVRFDWLLKVLGDDMCVTEVVPNGWITRP